MKSTIQEEIANVMGGNFSDPQVGSAGKIAGMDAPIGCPTPLTKKSCLPTRQARNKEDQERITKLVTLLLGKTFSREELTETKKPNNSLSISTGKASISGIGDQAAQSLPPAKNVPIKPNKIVTGVNGLRTDTPVIARVVSDLMDAKKRFPSMNLDPARAAIDGNYVYKMKNGTDQVYRYNGLKGIEMPLFRSEEDSDMDQMMDNAIAKHFDKHRIR